MQKDIRYILSIAGLDPSGGAGLFADVKVFEQFGLTGLGIATAVTYQNDDEFIGVKWLNKEDIYLQLKPLSKFPVKAIKIGLIENLNALQWLLGELQKLYPDALIVWDPILKASAGYVFHSQVDEDFLSLILKKIFCITPNQEEAKSLGKLDAQKNALELSKICNVVLKGGHSDNHSNDLVLQGGEIVEEFMQPKIEGAHKHGSGCVFSSALASALAIGNPLIEAANEAKKYTLAFLQSSETLLGKHKNLSVTL